MAERRKASTRVRGADEITATDLAQEQMGRNALQGDDQLSVRNQRRAQPHATKRVPTAIETMQEANPRVRARRANSDRKNPSNRTMEANVPAKSKKQQMAAGAALSAKRGERSKKSLRGASKQMEKSMSRKELRDVAGTKRKKLPKRASRR